jgi:hypothetical protein
VKGYQRGYEQPGVGGYWNETLAGGDIKQVLRLAAKPLNSRAVVGVRYTFIRRSNSYASLSGLRSSSKVPGADVPSVDAKHYFIVFQDDMYVAAIRAFAFDDHHRQRILHLTLNLAP